jgi:hypothetical protein
VQTARYVVKHAASLSSEKPISSAQLPSRLQYLVERDCKISVGDDGWLQAAFMMRAKWLAGVAIGKLLAHQGSGV